MDESKAGIVKGLIVGIGGLIIVTIIVLLIVSTIDNANLLRSTAATKLVANETGHFINASGDAIDMFASGYTFTIYDVYNWTAKKLITSPVNYTYASATGTFTNGSSESIFNNVSITYSYIPYTEFESSATNLTNGLNVGLNDVSEKIPTILLIGAVVLLFGVILFLVRQSQQMGAGGQGGSL